MIMWKAYGGVSKVYLTIASKHYLFYIIIILNLNRLTHKKKG